ncbi:hypothetical protein LguiA_006531 [Lonicera macranthoides]
MARVACALPTPRWLANTSLSARLVPTTPWLSEVKGPPRRQGLCSSGASRRHTPF